MDRRCHTPAGMPAKSNPPLIIDVRQPVGTKSGSVAGAVLVPLTELGHNMGEFLQIRISASVFPAITQPGCRPAAGARRLPNKSTSPAVSPPPNKSRFCP